MQNVDVRPADQENLLREEHRKVYLTVLNRPGIDKQTLERLEAVAGAGADEITRTEDLDAYYQLVDLGFRDRKQFGHFLTDRKEILQRLDYFRSKLTQQDLIRPDLAKAKNLAEMIITEGEKTTVAPDELSNEVPVDRAERYWEDLLDKGCPRPVINFLLKCVANVSKITDDRFSRYDIGSAVIALEQWVEKNI